MEEENVISFILNETAINEIHREKSYWNNEPSNIWNVHCVFTWLLMVTTCNRSLLNWHTHQKWETTFVWENSLANVQCGWNENRYCFLFGIQPFKHYTPKSRKRSTFTWLYVTKFAFWMNTVQNGKISYIVITMNLNDRAHL